MSQVLYAMIGEHAQLTSDSSVLFSNPKLFIHALHLHLARHWDCAISYVKITEVAAWPLCPAKDTLRITYSINDFALDDAECNVVITAVLIPAEGELAQTESGGVKYTSVQARTVELCCTRTGV